MRLGQRLLKTTLDIIQEREHVRTSILRYASICGIAGGLAGGALVVVTSTAASAHYTCADGTTTVEDDPAVACVGHGGVKGAGAPTATPAPPAGAEHDDEDDHGAPAAGSPATPAPTTAAPGRAAPTTTVAVRAGTATNPASATAPAAVTATPRYTG
jgi:hypothetical protein